ncbi:MAG: DedA family protein [Ignavibacteriaceae bacterium]|nr:DedA family protein [Ignavibacteriaceae bacterium]
MEYITTIIDFILHIDVHLNEMIIQYGTLTYGILFFIIFAETGFVFTPFLPGDSLLFAAGTFAARGSFDVYVLAVLLITAAIAGDNVNYWVGRKLGIKLFDRFNKLLKKEYLEKTQKFYEKHGGKTIILARFFPIIRTFSPFVAGLGKMEYTRFVINDIAGGIIWISVFVFGGYFFGNIPFVQKNFSLVIVVIIVISVIPALSEFIRHKFLKKK